MFSSPFSASTDHRLHQKNQLLSTQCFFSGLPVAVADGTGDGSTQINPKKTEEVHSSSSLDDFVFVLVTVAMGEEGKAGGGVIV